MRELIERSGDTVVASGYGVTIRVNRGQLVIDDGYGQHRRTRRFARATSDFRRLAIVGSEGLITFEAMRWITDIEASYIHIDSTGRLIGVGGWYPGNNPALRRRQALVSDSPVGVEIARWLIDTKIQQQTDFLTRRGETTTHDYQAALANARTLTEISRCEAQTARGYWRAWSDVHLDFTGPGKSHVQPHWRNFGLRSSGLKGTNRVATNPANALMNYTYALIEGSARLAAMSVGLDPGLGIMHKDYPFRDSLALDIMEPIRPIADRWLYGLFARHKFQARGDFAETRRGQCRLTPTFAAWAASTADSWDKYTSAAAEGVRAMLEGQRPPNALDKVLRARLPPHPFFCRKCSRYTEPHTARICAQCDAGRQCILCGLNLEGMRVDARYCSKECRTRAKDIRRQSATAVGHDD